MFRITGSIVQCLAKNYKNGSVYYQAQGFLICLILNAIY